jgi:prevent-host-death family protein
MTQTTIHKAKSNLSKLVARVQAGEEVIVCRGHEPVAMLVPYRKRGARRPKVGEITSKRVKCKPNCFGPLSEKEMVDWGMA